MRHIFSGGIVAAALGTALIVAGALPASAQVARIQPAFAAGDSHSSNLLTLVRDQRGGNGNVGRGRGGNGGGNVRMNSGRSSSVARAVRGNNAVRATNTNRSHVSRANNRRWANNNWRWRHRYGYWNRGYGYGSGFGVGIALGAPYYAYGAGYGGDAVAYCMSRFRTYDPASGTYTGYDGFQHPCP